MIHGTKANNDTTKKEMLKVTVLGAVRFHGPFDVRFGISIREILVKAELLYGANLKDVEFDKHLYKEQTLLIPFKEGFEKKIKLKDINLADLMRVGIRRKTSLAIMTFIRKQRGGKVTWSDLDSIRGVGTTTLNLLKKILDLS
ncbi:Soluble ligand binding domain-containing protein [Mycoplasma todarodis]